MSGAFYNERDPYAAQWLRNLIEQGHIAPGVVSEEDIRDLKPSDLDGFTQCHFFAGIGVWSLALRRAGWRDDWPIWTGSCPCQPFSAAGRRGGVADERHLWPHWFHLIGACRPPIVLGEQVASKDGLGWLDLVSADLEGADYAFGSSDLCAAGFGGAHIRQRLYFVGLADAERQQSERRRSGEESDQPRALQRVERLCDAGRLAHHHHQGSQGRLSGRSDQGRQSIDGHAGRGEPTIGLADSDGGDASAERQQRGGQYRQQQQEIGLSGGSGDQGLGHNGGPALGTDAPDRDGRVADWLFCRDGKWRPVEPGTFPLAHAAPARVGRLRAYGNALDAATAEGFVAGVMDVVRGLCVAGELC